MHLKPNDVIWAILLSSCLIHGKGDLFESIKQKILDQEPTNPGYLTFLSNLSVSKRRGRFFKLSGGNETAGDRKNSWLQFNSSGKHNT